jgi:transcriptional regulator with XRE-family HTH domain
LAVGAPVQDLGGLLREWRRKRGMSRLDLAWDAEISTKHLGSVETGRSLPTRKTLLNLAACLDVPLRDKNALLSAAGLGPLYQEHGFGAPVMDPLRRAVEAILAARDPCPALVVDRHWTMLSANCAVAHLVAGAEPMLLRPPVNVMRLFLHPAGLAPRIVNLMQWRAHIITRLRQQIDLCGDSTLMDLLEEIRDYPIPPDHEPPDRADDDAVAIPFRLATIEGVLSFFSTTTRFGTPVDITVSELAIEAFLPADAETAGIMRRLAEREKTRPAACAQPAALV